MEASQGIFVVVLILSAYLLPSIIALLRGVTSMGGIVIVNLLVGWTGIGWLAALVMACAKSTRRDQTEAAALAAGAMMQAARQAPHPTGS